MSKTSKQKDAEIAFLNEQLLLAHEETHKYRMKYAEAMKVMALAGLLRLKTYDDPPIKRQRKRA